MKLSEEEFDELLANNDLAISLIGMSNIGKTYLSQKLNELKFKRFGCDDIIKERLTDKLEKMGYKGIEDVARWLGQPYEKHSLENQKTYLQLEKQALIKIFLYLANGNQENVVIDTTGSLVHTGEDICLQLKEHSLIVYIEAGDDMEEQMFKQYLKEPRPVIWGKVFQPQEQETNQETLKRCYPELLDLRSSLYTRYADVVIPYNSLPKDIEAKEFLELIKRSL